jgi:hypothetical protein
MRHALAPNSDPRQCAADTRARGSSGPRLARVPLPRAARLCFGLLRVIGK